MDTEDNRMLLLLAAVLIQLIVGAGVNHNLKRVSAAALEHIEAMDINKTRILIYALVCVVVCIVSVNSLDECALCDCCKGVCQSTQNYKCDSDGCVDGYWGDQCRNKCNHNVCVACGRPGGEWCTKCKPGLFVNSNRHYCTKNCYSNCKTCTAYWTCTSCKDGYVNLYESSNCPYPCPMNCETCSSQNECSGCKPGFYDVANDCDKSCLQNCHMCNEAETCTVCKPGFYSSIENDCTNNCPTNCYSCSSNTTCNICNTGYYGNTCQSTCSHGCTTKTCVKDTGGCPTCWLEFTGDKCDSCITGKYGYNCNSICSTTCQGYRCDRNNGTCMDGCVSENYDGPFCEHCVEGRHGVSCDETCPRNCKGSTCDRTNGTCNQGCNGNFIGETCTNCVTGMFGENCTEPCPENCLNDTCDKLSGVCLSCESNYAGEKCENCAIGYYGQTCSHTCSTGCLDGVCNRTNGVCLSGCIGNYTGDKCCIHHENGKCALCASNDECSLCVSGFYGKNCTDTCSNHCLNGQCEIDKGYCTECLPNLFGNYCERNCSGNCYPDNTSIPMKLICEKGSGECIQGCKTGYFGFQCNSSCSQNCVDSVCNMSDGWCTYMCVDGFKGHTCAEVKHQQPTDPGSPGAVIGGGVGGTLAVVVIAVLVVLFFVIRRRRSERQKSTKKSNNFDGRNLTNPIYENSGNVGQVKESGKKPKRQIVEDIQEERRHSDPTLENDVHADEENTYYNAVEISVSRLYQYVSGRTTHAFKAEFQNIPNGLQKPYIVSQKPENVGKNRYKGMYPYDHSRVTIEGDRKFYMNACFIDGYTQKREYIASLGPTIATTDNFVSFWQMVWHHNVDTIVMLTNLIEKGSEKCHQYWPDLGTTVQYGTYAVTGQNKDAYVEYTATRLKLSCNGEDRIVHHLHFTVWPDKSVPEDVTSLVEFKEKVNSVRESNTGPIVVHCSAGVGRTGTYIALDKLTKEGNETGEVNVMGCVKGMREQRVNMVQTANQYEYLHKCLVYTLTSDCRLLSTDEIKTTLQDHSDDEFTKIHQMLQIDMNIDDADVLAREGNMTLGKKNRLGADVPGNKWRPRLFLNRGFNDSDYVNAVYVNSFMCTNRFIVAQTPLPETVEDFLTLVYQSNVTCIVCLDDTVQRGKNVGIYQPPENQEMKQGPFTISSERCQSTEQYTERTLKLTLCKGKTQEEKTMQHLQFSKWPTGKKVPADPAGFVQLTKLVDRIARSAETEQSNIVVHCLTGAERSGLFCAVDVLLEKLQLERHVSVLNTLRQIRLRRKTAIPNKEQVKFCYQCLSASQEETDIYYNV